MWSCGPVLSPSLLHLLEKTTEKAEDIGGEKEGQEIDYEELLSYDEYIHLDSSRIIRSRPIARLW